MHPAVREARESDVAQIHRLIIDLATYERAADQVKVTPEQLRDALFGPQPAVYALVAEADGAVVGFALYFLNFSTWEGVHGIYLEDLYVPPEQRGIGLGKALLTALAEIAVSRGYARVEWSVLDWNQPSIEFYRSLGAVADGRMDGLPADRGRPPARGPCSLTGRQVRAAADLSAKWMRATVPPMARRNRPRDRAGDMLDRSLKSSRPSAEGMTISSTKVTAATDVTVPRCRATPKKRSDDPVDDDGPAAAAPATEVRWSEPIARAATATPLKPSPAATAHQADECSEQSHAGQTDRDQDRHGDQADPGDRRTGRPFRVGGEAEQHQAAPEDTERILLTGSAAPRGLAMIAVTPTLAVTTDSTRNRGNSCRATTLPEPTPSSPRPAGTATG